MTYHNPTILPKVRSTALMAAMRDYPCTVRIASLIPGHHCAAQETVVGHHLGTAGKGMSTKSSDLAVVAVCAHCHALLERVDARGRALLEREPVAVIDRCLRGLIETHAMLARDGIITVRGGRLV